MVQLAGTSWNFPELAGTSVARGGKKWKMAAFARGHRKWETFAAKAEGDDRGVVLLALAPEFVRVYAFMATMLT